MNHVIRFGIMKIEDVFQQARVSLKDGGIELVDYTIKKEEIRHFVDATRGLAAKANRLSANVETLQRPVDLQDLTEFSVCAHMCQEYLFIINAFLSVTEAKIINYEQLVRTDMSNLNFDCHAVD